MVSLPTQPSETGGGRSCRSAPQVVVRAGKTWVCSACGVLVEVPPELVGQMVIVPEEAEQPEPAAASLADEVASREEAPPAEVGADTAPCARQAEGNSPAARLRRPKRPRWPAEVSSPRERIDGLIVPTTQEMDRLWAWVSYRLKQLDLLKQQENVLHQSPAKRRRPQGRTAPKRLVSGNPPRRHAEKVPLRKRKDPLPGQPARHAYADVSMAPELNKKQGRGPP